MYACVPHACLASSHVRWKSVRSPGTGVSSTYEPLCEGWEWTWSSERMIRILNWWIITPAQNDVFELKFIYENYCIYYQLWLRDQSYRVTNSEAGFDLFTETTGSSGVFLCREPPLAFTHVFRIPHGLTHIFSESPVGMWCDYANPQQRGCGDLNEMSRASQPLVSSWRCFRGVAWWRRHVTGSWLWELFWLFSLLHACSNLELWAKISPILHQGGGGVRSQPPVPGCPTSALTSWTLLVLVLEVQTQVNPVFSKLLWSWHF